MQVTVGRAGKSVVTWCSARREYSVDDHRCRHRTASRACLEATTVSMDSPGKSSYSRLHGTSQAGTHSRSVMHLSNTHSPNRWDLSCWRFDVSRDRKSTRLNSSHV